MKLILVTLGICALSLVLAYATLSFFEWYSYKREGKQ